MERWVGKCAVVTGASGGIGAAVVIALANAGMTVVAAARRLEKLQELPQKVKGPGKVLCCCCDVSIEKDIMMLMDFAKKHAGGVDILVNNAAILPTGTVTECENLTSSMEAIQECISINLMANIMITRLVISDIKSRKVDGHIVFLNSITGHRLLSIGLAPLGIYPVTKHAITVLNEIIRQECSYTKAPIRVTSISPGGVDTSMLDIIPNLPTDIPKLKTEDVADAILYAISVPQSVNVTELTLQSTGEMF